MYRYFFKRFLDILLSLIAIVAFFPLLLILTLVGFIKMRGNPFFLQKRPGKKERIFTLVKFKTMTNKKDAEGNLLPDADRLNKYGRFLRASSLDELPELFNIFIGNMSIVGPRPLLIKYLPLYNEGQKKRHNVRPGLTGLAQVSGRNAVGWEQKFEKDTEYVKKITFVRDLKIVLKTVGKVFKREGINETGVATMTEFTGGESIAVIGGSGHAFVVCEAIVATGLSVFGIFDDNLEKGYKVGDWEVKGKIDDVMNYYIPAVIAIGNNHIRKEIAEKHDRSYVKIIHPLAYVSPSAQIGDGSVVFAGAVVNSNATVGKHCIINTCAVVEHDNIIADYAHLSPNSSMSGNVKIGALTHIGTGACTKNNIRITDNVVVGAGAAVVADITEEGVYVGVPAKKKEGKDDKK